MAREALFAAVVLLSLAFFALGAETAPLATPANFTIGYLDVSSIPAGAEITLFREGNASPGGKTPSKIGVPEGFVELALKKQGYLEWKKTVYVYEGMTQDVLAELKLLPSPTPIISIPAPTAIDYSCNYTALKDRVDCRLVLTEEERARGMPFIPEECRIKVGVEFGECVSTYEKLKGCTAMGSDAEREMCARGYLGLKANAAEGKADCQKYKENERAVCLQELRKSTYALIIFRLNMIAMKAEKLQKMGVNLERTADFIQNLEMKKLEFGEANNLERRKQVIWEVKKLWGDFKRDALAELKGKKG